MHASLRAHTTNHEIVTYTAEHQFGQTRTYAKHAPQLPRSSQTPPKEIGEVHAKKSKKPFG